MKRLLLNGSPRGKDGNSRRLLAWMAEGLGQAGIPTPLTLDLAPDPTRAALVQAFLEADEIVFGFPLYTDSMPGIVKAFLETLASANRASLRGKRVAFVIQSGFPEAIHTEVLGKHLARLCQRLGFRHLGTLRRGNIEAIRALPPKPVAKVAALFRAAGKELGETGAFSPALVARLAGPRRFGTVGRVVVRLMASTGIGNAYWNGELKRHGAFARRFDAPYGDPA